MGLGVAMLFVPTLKVMTHWFKTEEFARMTGILMAVGGLGAYSASRPLAWLSDKLGWRGSFVVIGAATVGVAAAIWFLVRNTPQEMGFEVVNPSARDNTGKARTIGLAQGMRMVLSSGPFWVLAAWFFFRSVYFSASGGCGAVPI